ncbi:hypothetical protein [Streptomyces sp. HB2AG]|uniref:hypothetical protein n=1 Tax=Streptomyces sp. HB2AG TaxID=2983400 RepID=UPI0022AACD1B|nr:hypothetical protein [Streptomyces sp. HB2AG]MCZ2523858.1 hypothetical protein [Streptomyces sp. HB2AG]
MNHKNTFEGDGNRFTAAEKWRILKAFDAVADCLLECLVLEEKYGVSRSLVLRWRAEKERVGKRPVPQDRSIAVSVGTGTEKEEKRSVVRMRNERSRNRAKAKKARAERRRRRPVRTRRK